MKSQEQSTSQTNLNTHWRRFLTGDRDAFGQLMSVHYRVLFQYGSKFSKDKEFVKDCIQDLFLTLWEKRENLSAEAEPKPYMMASLRRLMHRSTSSRIRLGEGELDHADASFDIEFSVEHAYIEHESTLAHAERLQKLLEELPKRQKEVVYLKYFQEMDRDQISQVMAVTPQTVSNLLQIAIKQLKKHWRVALFLAFSFLFSIA